MLQWLKYNGLQSTLGMFLVVGTIFMIFTPETGFFQKTSEYTVHFMVFLLAGSMFFLLLNKKKIMFISLACCAALCIYLKKASNTHLILPEINLEPHITVAHINTSNLTGRYEQLNEIIRTYDPDVLSLQEVTPDWSSILENQLKYQFPFHTIDVRMDTYGMAMLSKMAISRSDTFQCKEVPNMINVVKLGEKFVHLLSSYVLPPLDAKTGDKTKKHLKRLSNEVKKIGKSVISLGDFNMVYWSNDIMEFRKDADLKNSRRDFTPLGFRKPYDHIFYSGDLECTKFKEIKDGDSNHVGIIGTYQFKSSIDVSDTKALLGYH